MPVFRARSNAVTSLRTARLLAALCLVPLGASAQVGGTGGAEAALNGGARSLWELGAAGIGVSQQAYPGAEQQVRRGLVLPYFVYRGRFLRADRETAGLRAVKTDNYEVDVGFAAAFGSRSRDIDARNGMRDLGTLVEFGPRLKWFLGAGPGGGRWRIDLPVRGVFDLSDGAAHRGMAFEPELRFERRTAGGMAYAASVGAVLADRRLAATFYEVRPNEVRPDRPAYRADAGLVAWRLGVSLSKPLGTDWRLFGFARLDTVTGAANEDSPLVRRTTGGTVGVGFTYTWMRSEATGND